MPVVIATRPARAGFPNEDFAGVMSNAAVLLDGAGLAGTESKCCHGVAWFTRHLGGALLANLADESASLQTTLAAAITEVADAHRGSCDLRDPGTPSATVVVIRMLEGELQYLVLADSVLVIEPLTGDPQVICDQREAAIGSQYRAAMDSAQNGTDEHREARRVYVEALRAHRNRPGGFWMAAADPTAASEALVGSRPLAETASVALLSDGASRLVDRFALMDWAETLTFLRTNGPGELLRRVREAEASDRHGRRWPRGKTHDDASVVLWLDPSEASPDREHHEGGE